MVAQEKGTLRKTVIAMVVLYVLLAIAWANSQLWAIAIVIIALGFVLYVNIMWSLAEKRRERIIEGLECANKPVLLVWPSALFLGINTLVLLPLGFILYSQLTHGAGFTPSESTEKAAWILFSLQQIIAAGADVLDVYNIRLSEITATHWLSQTAVFVVRLSISVLLIQGIVRVISLRSMIATSISTLASNPHFSAEKLQRTGSLAIAQVIDALQHSPNSKIRVGCARVLGQIAAGRVQELWDIVETEREDPAVVYASSMAIATLEGRETVLRFWLDKEQMLRETPSAAIDEHQLQALVDSNDNLQWCGKNDKGFCIIRRQCDNARMIFIPGGFTSLNGKPEELEIAGWSPPPAERIPYISGFFIDEVPVTVAQYAVFLNAEDPAGEADQDGRQWIYLPHRWGVLYSRTNGWRAADEEFLQCPMNNLSWYGAKAYARWAGVQLPTVAQWKRAWRGDFPDRRIYPWGNSPLSPELANYCHDDAPACPTPVRQLPAGQSPFGVQDMAGNVYEWTVDAYNQDRDYLLPAKDPEARDEEAPLIMILGGSWDGDETEINILDWYYVAPMGWLSDRGFRCVLPLDSLHKGKSHDK